MTMKPRFARLLSLALYGVFFGVLPGVLLGIFAMPLHAAEALQRIQAELVQEAVTEGEFRQVRKLAHIKKPLVSTGRFWVVRDLGVIWENVAPIAQTMRVTKNEILQTDGKGETLMRLSVDKEPVAGVINRILFGVLAGDFDALARNFNYTAKEEGGKWHLSFTPKDAHLARLIQSLSLVGKRDIEKVTIEGAAGDVTEIHFSAQKYARNIPDALRKRFE